MRAAYRAPMLFGMIFLFVINAFVLRLFVRSEKSRRISGARLTTLYSRAALKVLGVDVVYKGETDGQGLVVCNHMSYLDILIMAAQKPTLFITSVEVRNTPVLGTLAEMGGSVYTERRKRAKIKADISSVDRAFETGLDIVLFPEGTSTDGSRVLDFKSSLFAAAAGRRVKPAVLRYKTVDGEEFGASNCRKVCWYGSMRFLPHFLGVMRLSGVRAEYEAYPAIAGADRKQAAKSAHKIISEKYSERAVA